MFRFRKNHTLYKLILFICLSFSLPALAGNIKNYKFHTLSPEGGFYYDGVKSIQQDSDGFIWIVMENDLFRFDGYQFKRYYSYFRMLTSVWYKDVRSIETDISRSFSVIFSTGACAAMIWFFPFTVNVL